MRTPPPCMANGKACERRCAEPNCHGHCPDWAEWVNVHAQEVAREKKNRDSERELNSFLMCQGARTRSDNIRKNNERYKKGFEKTR